MRSFHGDKLASRLRSRLSDLSVTDNILLLPVGSPEVRFEDGEECITITFGDVKWGLSVGIQLSPKIKTIQLTGPESAGIRLVFIGDVK